MDMLYHVCVWLQSSAPSDSLSLSVSVFLSKPSKYFPIFSETIVVAVDVAVTHVLCVYNMVNTLHSPFISIIFGYVWFTCC